MHEERTSHMGVPNILNVIKRSTGQDTRQKGLITIEVAKTLSETAAIGEIHTRLSRHQPRIQLPMDPKEPKAKIKSLIETIATIQKTLDPADLGAFVTLFPHYPPLGKTLKNVDKIRAETTQDTFWREADQHFTKTTGKTLMGLMRKMDHRA